MLFGKHKPCVITVAALLSGVLLSINAAALGLGEITSSSLLGQPLQAEISVVDSAREYRAQDLLVQKLDITRAQQFGFDALSVNYDLVLELDNTDAGVVVRVASRRPVLEPFINFQVELQWPKGSLIREYTLFLDPPALAATAVDSRPAASGSGAGATTGPGNISNNVSKTAAGSAGAAAVASRRTAVTALTADSYRVQSGDSLSAIARRWSEGRGESPARVSQWLFQHNSQAFIGGDINRLKAGASLQLPQASDLPLQLGGESGSVGAVSAPAAAVQSESGAAGGNRAWMNNLPTREPASAVSPVPAPERDTDQAAGMLRLSEKSEGSTPSFAELDAESPEALKAYLDSTRESIDRVQRDNADLRRQIDTIENSDYINMLKELVELQAQQLEALNRQRSGAGSPAATTVVASTVVANPAAGGGVAAAATPPPGQSLLDINSATPPAQTPLANRDAYKGWAALGLLLLALILLALIIRRLWEQQGSRYKTRELPIAVAPITVTAGAAKASAAATPSSASDNAATHSRATNTGVAKSKAGAAPGSAEAAAAQSAAELEALPDLLDDDFEITDADLQTLGPLELDIDTGEVVPSPLTADAPKSKAKPEAKHEPAVKPPAKAPTGSPFEDLIPQMTHSIDDDWDELFDAIIGLDGGMESGIESDLEDGIDAGTFGGEPGAKDGVKGKLHKSKVKGLDKREGKNKGQDSFELSLEFESEPSATGPVANVPTAARKTVSKKAAGKLQMKPGNKPAEKPRKR